MKLISFLLFSIYISVNLWVCRSCPFTYTHSLLSSKEQQYLVKYKKVRLYEIDIISLVVHPYCYNLWVDHSCSFTYTQSLLISKEQQCLVKYGKNGLHLSSFLAKTYRQMRQTVVGFKFSMKMMSVFMFSTCIASNSWVCRSCPYTYKQCLLFAKVQQYLVKYEKD